MLGNFEKVKCPHKYGIICFLALVYIFLEYHLLFCWQKISLTVCVLSNNYSLGFAILQCNAM